MGHGARAGIDTDKMSLPARARHPDSHPLSRSILSAGIWMNIEISINKAVYMTKSVACGWAGAVSQVKAAFGEFLLCVTDQLTNQPTDGQTNRDL